MIKTLTAANRSEKTPFKIPRSVQQSIPIQMIYPDGIFHVGMKHSKTWRFADVNYIAASEEVKRSIFKSYSGVLNSLPTDAAAKITISVFVVCFWILLVLVLVLPFLSAHIAVRGTLHFRFEEVSTSHLGNS